MRPARGSTTAGSGSGRRLPTPACPAYRSRPSSSRPTRRCCCSGRAALYAFIRAREDVGWGWWLAVGIACGLGLLGEIRDGLLDPLGARLCPRVPRRAPPPAIRCSPQSASRSCCIRRISGGIGATASSATSTSETMPNLDEPLFHLGAFLEFFGSQFGVFGPLFFAGLILLRTVAAHLGRAARPPARLVYAADIGDDAGGQSAVARQCQLGGTRLRLGDGAGRCLGVGPRLAQARHLSRSRSTSPPLPSSLPAATRLPRLASRCRRNTTRSRRLRGWRDLGSTVGAALAAHPGFTLFADDRETLAALIYYVRPHPLRCGQVEAEGRPRQGPVGPDKWSAATLRREFSARLGARIDPGDEPSFAAIERLRARRHPGRTGSGPAPTHCTSHAISRAIHRDRR